MVNTLEVRRTITARYRADLVAILVSKIKEIGSSYSNKKAHLRFFVYLLKEKSTVLLQEDVRDWAPIEARIFPERLPGIITFARVRNPNFLYCTAWDFPLIEASSVEIGTKEGM